MLSVYERDGLVYSQLSEVLHQLVGGRREPVPLTEGPVSSAIYSDRVIIGRETVEIRHEAESRYAGILSFKEYPARTRIGMLDGVLSSPFEFILTQSFAFTSKSDARSILGRKQNQMLSSGDKAASQIGDLDQAMDDLESNRFVLGEHHLSVAVVASSVKDLADNLAKARASLTSGGAVVAREDLGLRPPGGHSFLGISATVHGPGRLHRVILQRFHPIIRIRPVRRTITNGASCRAIEDGFRVAVLF